MRKVIIIVLLCAMLLCGGCAEEPERCASCGDELSIAFAYNCPYCGSLICDICNDPRYFLDYHLTEYMDDVIYDDPGILYDYAEDCDLNILEDGELYYIYILGVYSGMMKGAAHIVDDETASAYYVVEEICKDWADDYAEWTDVENIEAWIREREAFLGRVKEYNQSAAAALGVNE